MTIETYEICDAYESGVGHGLKNDGHKHGPYGFKVLNDAYEHGYVEGVRRSAETKPSKTHRLVEKNYDHIFTAIGSAVNVPYDNALGISVARFWEVLDTLQPQA